MEFEKLSPDNQASPFAAQLKQGFARLRFADMLEKEFREFYIAQNLPRGRLSGLTALILVLAVTCLDYVFTPVGTHDKINTLRLGVLTPLLILMVVATYLPQLTRYYMRIVTVGVTLIGLVFTYICHVGALDGASYLLGGVVLVILYACLFLGLLFNTAVTTASFLVVAHLAMGAYLGLPVNELLYMAAILAAATIIGAVSTYNLEYALRTNFLETRLLNELAEKDGLTGLYNRRIFDDFVRRIWRQSRREQALLEIIFIDIDHFKVYNDLYGHQAGDDCLKKVAKRIASCAKRPFDFCARYGGEEFVLVLYDPPQEYSRTVPEMIRHDVMDLAIPHEGSRAAKYVTVSVGVAFSYPNSGRSLAGTIQTADEALYQAKQEGRNRVVFRDAGEGTAQTGNFRVSGYREMA